jgi:hypothetical protein
MRERSYFPVAGVMHPALLDVASGNYQRKGPVRKHRAFSGRWTETMMISVKIKVDKATLAALTALLLWLMSQ